LLGEGWRRKFANVVQGVGNYSRKKDAGIMIVEAFSAVLRIRREWIGDYD
jgi:hypothetical protein